ncbi:MAG TPA: pilus assembly protein PilM, partial [Nitrospiria bacterium]
HLSASGLDPESVDTDATALIGLARFAQTERAAAPAGASMGDTMVLDLGASKTTIGILSGGLPAYIRTVMQGGRDLTGALQQKYGITPEEAEEWKCQAGLMDEAITRLHEKNVSRILAGALEPLIEDLVRTIHVYEAGDDSPDAPRGKRSVTEFMLCGGGSKLKGLEEHLAGELGIPAASLLPKMATTNGRRWDPSFALGFGLALKGARIAGTSRMNFRKEEFSYTRETRAASHRARFLWIGALLVAAAAGADLAMKFNMQEDRYRQLKTEVRTQFREMFPDVKIVVDEVQQAKSAVADLRKRSNLLGAVGRSPLQLMAELTRRMPASVKVEVQDLVIEPGRVRLEAETNSFDSVDKIKAAIEESDAFKEATVSDAKVSADQSKVKFRLTITLAEMNTGEARP